MSLSETVSIFPQSRDHRLVGADLATFLDRLTERMVALGDGAQARVRAGTFEAHPQNLPALLQTIDAAREDAQGQHDLELRLWGDARDRFSRFLGTHSVEVTFQAFVHPQVIKANLCAACGWPLDYDGTRKATTCNRIGCGDEVSSGQALAACWRVQLLGNGSDGIGERFVLEGRRLEGTPFFEALEGAARARLFEWQAWS